jgi:hypothetical protein
MRDNFNCQILKVELNSVFKDFFSWYSRGESIVFNERIMLAIIQQDENSNTSRRRVVESSD